ncbi:hypothetical protein CMK22_16605 [Candidatus Poribacteria bacterium]|nr:hypothetical protein [Candidatus Poribacteria bacterium]
MIPDQLLKHVFVFILLLLSGQKFNQAKPTEHIQFTDVTEEANISFQHQDGREGKKYFIETIGSGCAFIDYDNDGNLDIYLVNATSVRKENTEKASGNRLYRNTGEGKFVDITTSAGVGDTGYGTGISAGDYDNNGFIDLYITNFGTNVLYKNNGNGTFTNVTQSAQVEGSQWSAGSSFGDYDRDGDLDLYVTNYCNFRVENHQPCIHKGINGSNIQVYCPPEQFAGVSDILYQNNGNGTFTDVTKESGLYNPIGRGMSPIWSDYDNDGDLDLFVANDATENFLYQNDNNGRFSNVAWITGVASDMNGDLQGCMGLDLADYDNDGDFDLIMTNFQKQVNVFYRNEEYVFFNDISFSIGLGFTLPYVSWGTGLVDLNNDGFRDLFVANGHTQDVIEQYDTGSSYLQPNHLLINDRRGGFVKTESIPKEMKASRGVAFGDYDNDGDMDILISNAHDRPTLLRNDSETDNHWLIVKTIGTQPTSASNRDGIGAKVRIITKNQTLISEVRSGSSYMSQNDMRVHFGLGKDLKQIDLLEVSWPSGTVDRLNNIALDTIVYIKEGVSQLTK